MAFKRHHYVVLRGYRKKPFGNRHISEVIIPFHRAVLVKNTHMLVMHQTDCRSPEFRSSLDVHYAALIQIVVGEIFIFPHPGIGKMIDTNAFQAVTLFQTIEPINKGI